MFLVYIGIYTLILAFIWGFFIVIRIHAYKFKNFSNNIVFVTNILFGFLLILSLLGYILISYSTDFNKNYSIDLKDTESSSISEVDY